MLAGTALMVAPVQAGADPGGGERRGVDHHIDCRTGRDANDGRSPGAPWRSLERAVDADIRPGDRVLLRAGCRWKGPMYTRWSGREGAPITIGAYGDGPRPVIEDASVQVEVRGAWVDIEGLHLRADAPTTDPGCEDHPAGRTFGAIWEDGAHHGAIRDSLITDLYAGVRVARGAHHVRIVGNTFLDNNVKSADPTSDAGAVAIDLQGDDNEVAFNRIGGSAACSPFYGGWDGSAISVFGGRRNVIHHNVSVDNNDFVEVGHPRARDTLVAYNTDRSDRPLANFVVVHGDGSRYGPTQGTRVHHNTAVLTGGGDLIGCSGEVGPEHLSLRGNILWAEGRAISCATTFDEGDNRYWRTDGMPDVPYPIHPSSRVADPGLVDALGGDLRLRPDSSAIDAMVPIDLAEVGGRDAAGVVVPQGRAPDIGAFEWSAGSSPGPGPVDPWAGRPTSVPDPSGVPDRSPVPGPSPSAVLGGGPGAEPPAWVPVVPTSGGPVTAGVLALSGGMLEILAGLSLAATGVLAVSEVARARRRSR